MVSLSLIMPDLNHQARLNQQGARDNRDGLLKFTTSETQINSMLMEDNQKLDKG